MTTYDNHPPQPDWAPPIGNLCGGCGQNANLCESLSKPPVDEPCCSLCTHAATAPATQVWAGDNA